MEDTDSNCFIGKVSKMKSEWAASHIGQRSVLNISDAQGINAEILSDRGANVYQLSKQQEDDIWQCLYNESSPACSYQTRSFECIAISEDECGEITSEGFIERALTLLDAGGTLVVVSPFGDGTSQKNRYYFEGLFHRIGALCTVIGASVNDQWIGYIAIKKPLVSYASLNELSKIETGNKEDRKSLELLEKYITGSVSCIKEAKLIDTTAKKYICAYQALLKSRSVRALIQTRKTFGMRFHIPEKAVLRDQQLKAFKLDIAEATANSCINTLSRSLDEDWRSLNVNSVNRTTLDLARKAQSEIESVVLKLRHEDECRAVENDGYAHICKLSSAIPQNSSSSYFGKPPFRCGIVANPAAMIMYQGCLDFIDLSSLDFDEIDNKDNIDFIILAYRETHFCQTEAIDTEAWGKAASNAVAWANKMDLPIILLADARWNSSFTKLAYGADCIFTSDASFLADFDFGIDIHRVLPLRPCVNPAVNNPIGFLMRHFWRTSAFSESILFSDTWVNDNAQRIRDMRFLFDSARSSAIRSLIISDAKGRPDDPICLDSNYPSKYMRNLIPSLTELELSKVNKLFDFTLYVTSPNNLAHAYDSRLAAIQAMGSIVLANYSLYMSAHALPHFMLSNSSEIDIITTNYTEHEIISLQLEGIRNVMSSYTVYDQLNSIFDSLGLDFRYPKRTVFVLSESANDAIGRFLDNQTYKNTIRIDGLASLEKSSDEGYFIAVDDNSLSFDRHFIEDAVNAFKFTDKAYVNYGSGVLATTSYCFVSGTASTTNTLFNLQRIDPAFLKDDKYLASLDGFEILAPDWGRSTSQNSKELAVIIPIYNNGKYLLNRCFLSLLRSSVFNKMHIYLIDDGSTDGITIDIIKKIAIAYDNITVFYFDDGGSGSASRPRNKGAELSSEPYITYLDPDNEAVNDGYSKLLCLAKEHDVDFVAGYHSIVQEPGFEAIKNVPDFPEGVIDKPKEMLYQTKFYPLSMQACVFRSEFIKWNNLSSVEGAVGQDTLFYYETMGMAKSFFYLDEPIHIYYAERVGSTVNTPGKKFFDKSLKLEIEQVKRLDKLNILDQYIDLKLDTFVDEWYKPKLRQVVDEDSDYCKEIVRKIVSLYRNFQD